MDLQEDIFVFITKIPECMIGLGGDFRRFQLGARWHILSTKNKIEDFTMEKITAGLIQNNYP